MKKIVGYVLLILLVGGCATPVSPISPQVSSTPPTIEETSVPTLTSQPSVAPTPTSNLKYVQQCIQIETQDTALKDVTTGTVVQDNVLLDIQAEKKYPLRTTGSFNSFQVIDRHGLQVSPGRKMFAYIETIQSGQQALWIVNAQAEMLAKISFRRNDLETPRWLDNEHLVFYTAQTDIGGSVLVINPFIQEQTTVSNELPILDFLGARKSTLINWLVEYSPDLNLVIYLDNHGGVSLRDVLTKKTLWNAEYGGLYGKAVWSPDGQQVAVVANGQLYVVDRFGQARPILNKMAKLQPTAPSWSPDGHKVAFWDSVQRLIVYDQQMGRVVDLCIGVPESDVTYPVRWSPDSRQLIIEKQISANPMIVVPQVIDLQKSVMYTKILGGENIRGEVWMNSLP